MSRIFINVYRNISTKYLSSIFHSSMFLWYTSVKVIPYVYIFVFIFGTKTPSCPSFLRSRHPLALVLLLKKKHLGCFCLNCAGAIAQSPIQTQSAIQKRQRQAIEHAQMYYDISNSIKCDVITGLKHGLKSSSIVVNKQLRSEVFFPFFSRRGK